MSTFHEPGPIDVGILGRPLPTETNELPTSPTSPPFLLGDVAGEDAGPPATRRASEITPRRARWLWTGRIPAGDLTLAVGRGGLGKSTAIGADLAARLSRGLLPGDRFGAPSDVVIASAEDSPEHTLVPRLIAAEADLSHVVVVDGPVHLPDGAVRLGALLERDRPAALILDPLNAYIGGGIDSHRDHDLRTALAPLAELAHRFDVAIVAVGHVNKARSGDAYQQVSGSVGYYNAVRSVLVVTNDPDADDDQDGRRVLIHAKSNLGRLANPIRFQVVEAHVETVDGPAEVARVEWGNEAPELSVHDALAGVDGDERSATADALEWLREFLADGPRPANEVKLAGHRAGHSRRTLERARRQVAETRRDGFQGPFVWSLRATSPATSPDSKAGEVGEVGERRPSCSACRTRPAITFPKPQHVGLCLVCAAPVQVPGA